MSEQITIRQMREGDPQMITDAFAEQGWNKPRFQFENYLVELAAGKRVAMVAELDGEFAGYITLLWTSKYPPFAQKNIPEINDLNVLIKFQRRRIGSALLNAAEQAAADRSDVVGIGVGLTVDYGPAQRLYVSRGYLPDGQGIRHKGKPVSFGDTMSIDDQLNLYSTKQIGHL